MADKAVSALPPVVNHAAIGNCFMVSQKGAGAGSTDRASVSALQIDYSRVANAYPFGNGDGNAKGNRAITVNSPISPGAIGDILYEYDGQVSNYSNARIISETNPSIWSFVSEIYVKINGSWKQVFEAWIKDNNAWKSFLRVQAVITIAGGNNINLRSVYQTQTGDFSNLPVYVIFNITGNIGSTSTSNASLVTGPWPSGSKIIVNIANGIYVAGAGGGVAAAGGSGISLGYNVTLNNSGVIAGGGGGGGSLRYTPPGGIYNAYGGSGAGLVNGVIYNQTGGSSFRANCGFGNAWGYGGTGGGLGSAGGGASNNTDGGCNMSGGYLFFTSAGSAGKAIALNGYTAITTGNAPLGAVS